MGTLVLSGTGALDELGRELQQRGLKRAMLISSPSAYRGEGMRALREALRGVEIRGSFTGVRQHAPEDDIRAAAAALAANDVDFILAVGGASVGDTAKGAALLHAGAELELDFSGLEPGLPAVPGLLPIVNVPLTLAGAEFLSGGSFSRKGHKDGFIAPGLAHSITVYDPSCLADVPTHVLCSSAFNALAHALESSCTDRATPYSRALAAGSASRFARWLPARAAGDTSVEVLTGLSEAAILGALAYVIGMGGVHHAVCHALGGLLGIPHASANATVLPYALAANETFSESVQTELAVVMGRELERYGVPAGLPLAESVKALQGLVHVPGSLAAFNIADNDLDDVAREVMVETRGGTSLRPRMLNEVQVRMLLSAAWSGDLNLARF